MAEEVSPEQMRSAISKVRNAERKSDIAMSNALKDNEETNKKLNEMAKDTDAMIAKINKIGNRLADPHERSEKVKQRREARLQKKVQRQYEKTQQLIQFWSKKFIKHIEVNNITDDEMRKEDETLTHIELKLKKYGIDTDELFKTRRQSK